ncbi:hybrid sensor histidine kinase/response regulator [Methylocella silvestris]|uniref:histidine kinase n=1 Tax=Methylocella silvestris TaxID=199596 RepID=A0A2J7TDS1_METSI|nr:hybrid sensor histidine kinase/response regulator [Methylocella silvestris]PNG24899.1 hybrid sensor histidine kinase/response regulator [Methylocella silvestris]
MVIDSRHGDADVERSAWVAIADGLDAISTGIAIWGSDRRLLYANQSFRRSFGANGSEIAAGLTFSDYLRHAARSGEWLLPGPGNQWIESQEALFGIDERSEVTLADGRTLDVAQKPVAGGGMALTIRDVSSTKQSERALRHAKEKAEEMDQAKSRFLRAASHDLRQPLATLRILVYNCMREEDKDRRDATLHVMETAVSIMEDLLGSLLQIGQLDAGRIIPRVTTFQLGELFRRLDVQFRHLADEKALVMRFVAPRGAVTSDKALLERILSNLVANAIRYTEFGGILIGCRRVGRALRIEVWDTGAGIEAEYLPRIFDEFYKAPNATRTQKTSLGLGLNIVKRLASLLEHEVTVRSSPNNGTVFTIAVPIGNLWHSAIGEPEISEMLGGEFVGMVMLVIEDDDVLRRAMKELLERWGIIVLAVDSQEQALQVLDLEKAVPRLIIADYNLRGRFGTEVVRALHDALGRDAPSIIVTADADPCVIERIKLEGFPVLIKPVSPPRLRVLMHKLIFEPG